MALLAAIGIASLPTTLWSGVSGVFQYNQAKWQFDKQMKQQGVYHAHEMAAQQVYNWREDLRDLFDLINDKMNSYTLCSTLVAGFSITLLVDAHTDHSTPSWLFICANLQIVASFAYSIASLMFSIYASVVVRQLKTKTMTEIVRVPIPTDEAIRKASAQQSEMESLKAKNVKTALSIPIVSQLVEDKIQASKVKKGKYIKHSEKAYGRTMKAVEGTPHVEVFNALQESWMPLVKFAHICMTSSLICLIYGILFMSIANHLGSGLQIGGTFCIVLVLTTLIILLLKMEMIFSPMEWLAMVLLHLVPSMLSFVIQLLSTLHSADWALYGPPFVYMCQGRWILTLMRAVDPERRQVCRTESGEVRCEKFRLAALQDLHFTNQAKLASRVDRDHPKRFASGDSILSIDTDDGMPKRFASGDSILSHASSSLSRMSSDAEAASFTGAMPSPSASVVSSVACTTILEAGTCQEISPVEVKQHMQNQHRFAALLLRSLAEKATAQKLESRRFRVASAHFVQLSELLGEPQDYLAAEPCVDPRAVDARAELEPAGEGPCVRCVAGHLMRECSGRQVRRFQDHWCCLCLRNLARQECRYTCDLCSQFEVCTTCTEAWVEQGHELRFDSYERPRKLERMLRNVLADMQKGMEHYLDKVPPDPLANPKTPIKGEKLEQALDVERTLQLEELPWQAFRTISSILVLCYSLLFVWSLVQICYGQSLGRPHAAITTGAASYLDLAGDVGERRLLQDPPATLQLASLAPGPWSSTAEVAGWLRSIDLPVVAEQVERRQVDGPMLQSLDEPAWQELGLASAVERARLSASLALQRRDLECRASRGGQQV